MTGLGTIALNTAPVVGGAMLGVAAGQFRAPDFRGLIKKDMDLLDRLPPEAGTRRTELQRTIDARIDDLIETADRSRSMRRAALSYQGNWRDIVLLVCVVLFSIIWWDIDHTKGNWLPMFLLLIILMIVTAAYAFRGVLRAAGSFLHRHPHVPDADAPR